MKKSITTTLCDLHVAALKAIASEYECSESHVLRIAFFTLCYFLHMEESGKLTYFHIENKLRHEKDYR